MVTFWNLWSHRVIIEKGHLVPGAALLAPLLEDLGQDCGRHLLVVADVGNLTTERERAVGNGLAPNQWLGTSFRGEQSPPRPGLG